MADRTKTFSVKYSLDETLKRAKILLPLELKNLELELDKLIGDFEPQLFQEFERLGVPVDQYDYYMAYAKRVFKTGLKHTGTIFSIELDQLKNEFKLRGLDESILNSLDLILKYKIRKYRTAAGPLRVLLILHAGYTYMRGYIFVVDPYTFTWESTIDLGAGHGKLAGALCTNNKLYVGRWGDPDWWPGELIIFDARTCQELTRIQSDVIYRIIEDEQYIYVFGVYNGITVTKILKETNSIVDYNNLGITGVINNVIEVGGYLYLATNLNLYRISKETLELVGQLIPPPAGVDFYGLDFVSPYLYAGIGSPAILRVDLVNWPEYTALSLPVGDRVPYAMANDGTYLYFGTNYGVPPVRSKIVRIDLSTFTRKDELMLQEDERGVTCLNYFSPYLYAAAGATDYGDDIYKKFIRIDTRDFSYVDRLEWPMYNYGIRDAAYLVKTG